MSLDESTRSALIEYVTPYLVAGFWELADITDWALHGVDGLEECHDEATLMIQGMWNDRLTEQAGWPDTGDYGRLQRVFDQLEAESIVARMNFSCCASCAYHDIASEGTWTPSDGIAEIGYVYFHQQEALNLGHPNPTLYLGFGSFNPHPTLPEAVRQAARDDETAMADALAETDVLVGRRIVELAAAQGLAVTWSDSSDDCVELFVPQWRKPLPVS